MRKPLAPPVNLAVLEELLPATGEQLLRTAVLLAGSRADGEDLLQAALTGLQALADDPTPAH